MATTKAVELIVSGEVQGVGYRQFVAKIGRKLKLVGFAENLRDGTVKIRCKGEAAAIGEFKRQIKVKGPPVLPLIDVETVTETQLNEREITETIFEEKFGDAATETSQSSITGVNYLNLRFDQLSGKIDGLGNKVDNLSAETKSGFDDLGNKMDNGFSGLGNKIDQKFDTLDGKYGKVSSILEKINTNIEKTANKKKGIF